MEEFSPYELLRLKRVEENRKVLIELGLLECTKPPVIKRRPVKNQIVIKKKTPNKTNIRQNGVIPDAPRRTICTRRSSTLSFLSGETKSIEADATFDDDLSETESRSSFTNSTKKKQPRPNVFGPIPGIPVGTTWMTRIECSRDGVHRPTVAGIHGCKEGAYSLALSGGYEDDLDFGEGFTYTGSGGRDLKGTATKPKNLRTAPQSKDQRLEGVNASLAASIESKLPVRVIRGYKLPSVYAPEEGYRYDGLYTVEKFWFATGQSGFQVIKYALKRLKDQEPPPWTDEQVVNGSLSQSANENGHDPSDPESCNYNETEEKVHEDKSESVQVTTSPPHDTATEDKQNTCENLSLSDPNLIKLPGQTSILNYYKRSITPNVDNVLKNNLNVPDKITTKKAIEVNNVRSLRGNKRPSAYAENFATDFPVTNSDKQSVSKISKLDERINYDKSNFDDKIKTGLLRVRNSISPVTGTTLPNAEYAIKQEFSEIVTVINNRIKSVVIKNKQLDCQEVANCLTSPLDQSSVEHKLSDTSSNETSVIVKKRKNKQPVKINRVKTEYSSLDEESLIDSEIYTNTNSSPNSASLDVSRANKQVTEVSIKGKPISASDKYIKKNDQSLNQSSEHSLHLLNSCVELKKLADNDQQNFLGWDYTDAPNFEGFKDSDISNAKKEFNSFKQSLEKFENY